MQIRCSLFAGLEHGSMHQIQKTEMIGSVSSCTTENKTCSQSTPALASSPGCHFKDWLVFFLRYFRSSLPLLFSELVIVVHASMTGCHCQYGKSHFSSTFTNTFGQAFHTTSAGIHVIHLPRMTKTGEQTAWPEALQSWQMCSGTTSMHHEP